MTEALSLSADLRTYWHCGTGTGIAAHHDATVARDALGLPLLPGRTLRGLLRDAVRQLEEFGHAPRGSAVALFGEAGFGSSQSEIPAAYRDTQPGLLVVADGLIDPELRSWIADSLEDPGSRARAEAMRAELFRTLSLTAVDRESGTAQDASLRMIEVAIPVRLSAEIELARLALPPSQLQAQIRPRWREIVGLAANLVRAVGGHRSRGLGRCVLTVKAL